VVEEWLDDLDDHPEDDGEKLQSLLGFCRLLSSVRSVPG
jgi:hypothetical protein